MLDLQSSKRLLTRTPIEYLHSHAMMEKGKERDLLSPAVGEDDAAEKKRKSFERSLAGQSVNKAGQ